MRPYWKGQPRHGGLTDTPCLDAIGGVQELQIRAQVVSNGGRAAHRDPGTRTVNWTVSPDATGVVPPGLNHGCPFTALAMWGNEGGSIVEPAYTTATPTGLASTGIVATTVWFERSMTETSLLCWLVA